MPAAHEDKVAKNIINSALAAAKIKEIKKADYSNISLRKMVSTLVNYFGVVPTCEGLIAEGIYILRARINYDGTMYNSEKELSYRPDDWAVRNYGRAHSPVRSVFYGVLGTESREAAIETVLSETNEIFRNTDRQDTIPPLDFFCTISAWKVIRPIEVAQMLFSIKFVNNIKWIRDGYIHFLDNFASKLQPEQIETVRLLLEFISDEFAKPLIRTHEDYIISAAYSQFVIESTPLKGILYPSVRTNGYGVNVALYPSTVDRCTSLKEIHYCRITTTPNNELIIAPLKRVSEFGPMNSSFIWEDNVSVDST